MAQLGSFSHLILVLALTAKVTAAFSYENNAEATKLLTNQKPQAVENVGVKEKLGQTINLDVELVDEKGQPVNVSSLTKKDKPTLLTIVYYTCPSLCNLHLNGLMESLEKVSLKPGKDYEIIAISMEPKDTPAIAADKKQNYMKTFNMSDYQEGIHFLTGPQTAVRKISEQVGFDYKWDDVGKQWSHASAAIFLSPQYKITRYLHGISFEPQNLKLAIVESSEGKVGTFADHFQLFCFNYSPKENRYALAAFNVMRLGAVFTLVILGLWLIPVWWRARKQKS